MNGTKTVKVTEKTHRRLAALGVKGDTYGAIIARHIDYVEANDPHAARLLKERGCAKEAPQ